MTHAVCIYLDKNIATEAAALVRGRGTSAHIKVENLRNDAACRPVFILEADKSQGQKVIDSIANAADSNPKLAQNALHCPECNSIQVSFPGHSEVSPTIRGLSQMMEVFGRFLNMKRPTQVTCQKCAHQWSPSTTEK